MKLTVLAVKRPDGLWHFDHEHENTKEELLCNGTEKVIDFFYQYVNLNSPIAGSKLKIELDTDPPAIDCDTILTFVSTDDYGTIYVDSHTGQNVWLCPWLQSYFGYKPTMIYIMVSEA